MRSLRESSPNCRPAPPPEHGRTRSSRAPRPAGGGQPVRKLEAAGVITGCRATVDLGALGYGIRALVRVRRADCARMARLIEQAPEIVNAWNVTGEDDWIFDIAVADVAHFDEVVSKMCRLAETSTSIILKTPRQHQPMLPRAKEPAP